MRQAAAAVTVGTCWTYCYGAVGSAARRRFGAHRGRRGAGSYCGGLPRTACYWYKTERDQNVAEKSRNSANPQADEDENTRTPKLTVVITMALSLTRQHAVIYGDVVWGLAFAQYSWPNYVALTIINADKTRRNRNPVAVTAVTTHPINQPWWQVSAWRSLCLLARAGNCNDLGQFCHTAPCVSV